MLGIGCSLADLQQFFTGKLYVLTYQLKLPAEELLWSALSCTEAPSVPGSDMRIMSDSRSNNKHGPSPRGNPVTYAACSCVEIHTMTPAVSCNKSIASWGCGLICHFGLVFMIAVQFSVCVLMICYYNVVVQCWHNCKFHLACIIPPKHILVGHQQSHSSLFFFFFRLEIRLLVKI